MQEDNRKSAAMPPGEFLIVEAIGEYEKPICIVFAQRAMRWIMDLRGMDEQIVARLMRSCLDAFQHGLKECATDLRQEQANGMRTFACQHACGMPWYEI